MDMHMDMGMGMGIHLYMSVDDAEDAGGDIMQAIIIQVGMGMEISLGWC